MGTTRDYRRQFKEAAATNNKAAMTELFDALCNEFDVPDPQRDQSQAAAGKALAELLNARDSGSGGKIQK
jgi:hypothetical protein